jgi:hypothetical protein
MILFQQAEATANRRKFKFVCVDDTDGVTPEHSLTFSSSEVVWRVSGGSYAALTNIGSIVEVDATGEDAEYEGEFTQSELTGVDGAVYIKVKKTGVRTTVMCVGQVVPWDPYDAVRLGMTSLPNAAAEASGGLYTRGTGAGQINQPANGMVDVNAVRHLGTAYATPTVAGVPEVDPTHWNGTAVATPTTPGVPRVDVKAMEANTLTASALATDAVKRRMPSFRN